MKPSRRAILAGLASMACVPRAVRAAPTDVPRASIADFMSLDNAERNDAEPAFRAALARLPPTGGVLEIPPGTWSFSRSEGVAIPVRSRPNITIEGPGATLLFRGATRPFGFDDCASPNLRGFTIDWDRPPFSQGEVIAVGPDLRSVDVRVDAAFSVDGSEPVVALQTMEPGTLWIAKRGVDANNPVSDARWVGDRVVRLTLSRPLPLHPGAAILLRHRVAGVMMEFSRCGDLVVEGVTLNCGPGMGLIANGCDRASIRRLTIAPPPRSSRSMSLTADGLHFAACRGAIEIVDCHLEGMGDDGANIHGKYYTIMERLDQRTLRVSAPPNTLFSATRDSPVGDRFEVVGHRYERLGEPTVFSEEKAAGSILLHFAQDVPDDLTAGDMVIDEEIRTATRIMNCRFPGNRARGVLAHADTAIEGCTFAGQSGPAILLATEYYFKTGPLIDNVAIRDNDIANVCRVAGAAAISITAEVAGRGATMAPDDLKVNRNVSIEGNRFADLIGPMVAATSIKGLSIKKNQLVNGTNPAIVLDYADDLQIENNVLLPHGPMEIAHLPERQ